MLRQEPKAVGKARLDIPGMVNRADTGDLIIKKNPGLLAIINTTHHAGNDVARGKKIHILHISKYIVATPLAH